jgi:hypothetical protein
MTHSNASLLRFMLREVDAIDLAAGLFSSVSMIGGIAQSESRRGMRQGKKCLSLREDM